MNAQSIINLLAAKHSEDVFVSELKSGSTWMGSHFRLDGWAMKKSWAKPRVTGYEVKVSKSDFRQDDKWQQYLTVCNELFFVCPYGLLEAKDMPGEVGLMQTYKDGKGLRTIKKAGYRQTEIPEAVYRYILFSRAKIVTANQSGKKDKQYWDDWLKMKKDDRIFGQTVAHSLSHEKQVRLRTVEEENSRLWNENQKLEEVRQFLKENNISMNWNLKHAVQRKVEQAKMRVPPHFIGALEQFRATTDQLINTLNQ